MSRCICWVYSSLDSVISKSCNNIMFLCCTGTIVHGVSDHSGLLPMHSSQEYISDRMNALQMSHALGEHCGNVCIVMCLQEPFITDALLCSATCCCNMPPFSRFTPSGPCALTLHIKLQKMALTCWFLLQAYSVSDSASRLLYAACELRNQFLFCLKTWGLSYIHGLLVLFVREEMRYTSKLYCIYARYNDNS